jgi:hypothetical protein
VLARASFPCGFCCRGEPGLGPAADSLSLACPRESKQREGQPTSGPLSRFPALLASDGVRRKLALRAQTAASPRPPAAALLGPASTAEEIQNSETNPNTARTRHGASLFLRYWLFIPASAIAVMRRRVAQGRAEKGWRCLGAASFARPCPDRATQRTGAAGRRIRLSFLLGSFLWTSKQKDFGLRAETRLAARSNRQRQPPTRTQPCPPAYCKPEQKLPNK